MSKGAVPGLHTFLTFAQADDDLQLVLRCHLALEVVLNAALPTEGTELDRLPFMAKVDVAIALGNVPADLRDGFVYANRLRNRLAHKLDAELTQEDARAMLASFEPSHWDGFFENAHKSALLGSHRDQIGLCFAALFFYAGAQAGVLEEMVAELRTRKA